MLGRIVTCALVTMLAFEFFSMKGSTSDCLAVTLNAGTFVVALVTLVVAYKTYRHGSKSASRLRDEVVKYEFFDSPNLRVILREHQKEIWKSKKSPEQLQITVGGWTREEIEDLKKLELENLRIPSLGGIETFSSLQTLCISSIGIPAIDLYGMKNLKQVVIADSMVSSVSIRNCENLQKVRIRDCSSLTQLRINGNQLLDEIEFASGSLKTAVCVYGSVSNSSREADGFSRDNVISRMEIRGNSRLSGAKFFLDVGYFAMLQSLDCSNGAIKELKGVSEHGRLRRLVCSGNELAELSVVDCYSLVELGCSKNEGICKVRVSRNPCLKKVWLFGSRLSEGESSAGDSSDDKNDEIISECESLEMLWVHGCGIKFLGSLPESLRYLNCSENKELSIEADSLPTALEYLIARETELSKTLFCKETSRLWINSIGERCQSLKVLELPEQSVIGDDCCSDREFCLVRTGGSVKLKKISAGS